MTPSLAQLPLETRSRFRLRTRDGVMTLPEILAAARALAPTLPACPGPLAIPARDPLAALVHLEAALLRGLVPVPSTRTHTPSPIDIQVNIPGAQLAIRTSGSTGAPRLPAFAFASLVRAAHRIAAYLALGPDDEVALLQPLDHGFGLVGQLFAAIAAGAAVTDCASPYPSERADAVIASQATVVAAVPHTLRQLAEHLPELDPLAARNLRSVGSAGGRLPPILARRLALAFPDAVVWNQYGCTEAGPRLTAVPSTHVAFYTGTVGRAVDGVHLWIAQPAPHGPSATADAPATPDGEAFAQVMPAGRPGEICFSSDTQMLGYLGDPDATRRQRRTLGATSGFFTGDLGLLDPDDRLHVLGRADDLVKVKGERVSLEALARAAEAAGARAAIALVDEPAGDEPDGCLTLVYEADHELDLPTLTRALPPSVPMAPRRLLWVPALPRLPSGKPDRAAIELLAALAAPSARTAR